MVSAESLYEADTTADKNPPIVLDVVFLLVISLIHLVYSFKFTKFSLGYLHAKCAEKLSETEWSESKLYFHAIRRTSSQNNETDQFVNTELWDQLIILRYILRILLFLCCWVVLTVYITIQLNLGFEYFILCVLRPDYASYLGFILFPFFFFIHIAVIRYIIYGIIVSWKLNIDSIMHKINYEQRQTQIKQFAASPTQIINNDSKRTIFTRLKDKLAAFNSPNFMAVHWRLWTVGLSVLFTIIGFPFVATLKNEHGGRQGASVMQLFIRYIFIAMGSWLSIYCLTTIITSLGARLSTLFMFDATLNDDGNLTQSQKRKNSFWRLFCLIDAFGLKDTNVVWKKFKIIAYFWLFGSGIIFLIVGASIGDGLVWFIGLISLLYYVFNVLLSTKPRGMYFLWTADLLSLELKHKHEEIDLLPNVNHTEMQLTISRNAHVISSEFGNTLMKEMRSEETNTQMQSNLSETKVMEEIWEEQLSNLGSINHDSLPKQMQLSVVNVERDVLLLFTTNYESVCSKHRKLVKNSSGALTKKCTAIAYYFSFVFQLYKQYWLLILPFNYKIRPLSLICSGKSITETVIKYDRKSKTSAQIMKTILFDIIFNKILKWPLLITLSFSIFYVGLYASVKIHNSLYDIHDNLTENINGTEILSQGFGYPICDSLQWNGNLSTLDLMMLSIIPYDVENITDASEITRLYFGGNWEVVYVSDSLPHFLHLRHAQNKTDLIAIRGTKKFEEFIQDFALFHHVFWLQVASWIIPVMTVLPQPFIIQTVFLASAIEGVVENDVRSRYDIPVFDYAWDLLQNEDYQTDSLYFVGHSLGGNIGVAVAAQLFGAYGDRNSKYFNGNLEIKSFAVASPGMLYNSRRFSLNVKDVYSTATVIKPRYDVFAKVDRSVGLVQNVECHERAYWRSCHSKERIIYELIANDCNIYRSNNPTIIKRIKECIESNDDCGSVESHYNLIYI